MIEELKAWLYPHRDAILELQEQERKKCGDFYTYYNGYDDALFNVLSKIQQLEEQHDVEKV